MAKRKVLFICVHNSARSQMAAALLNQTCGESFEAQSAGLEPGTINPLVIEALQEIGLDISKNTTQRVFFEISRPISCSASITSGLIVPGSSPALWASNDSPHVWFSNAA